jgi:hypothetical protein
VFDVDELKGRPIACVEIMTADEMEFSLLVMSMNISPANVALLRFWGDVLPHTSRRVVKGLLGFGYHENVMRQSGTISRTSLPIGNNVLHFFLTSFLQYEIKKP